MVHSSSPRLAKACEHQKGAERSWRFLVYHESLLAFLKTFKYIHNFVEAIHERGLSRLAGVLTNSTNQWSPGHRTFCHMASLKAVTVVIVRKYCFIEINSIKKKKTLEIFLLNNENRKCFYHWQFQSTPSSFCLFCFEVQSWSLVFPTSNGCFLYYLFLTSVDVQIWNESRNQQYI